jgi:hypothetical protein
MKTALIELITEGPPAMLPECDRSNVPGCVQLIRFRVERNFLAPQKPTRFTAQIAVAERGESFVAEIRGDTFGRLKNRLRKFLGKISAFERHRERKAVAV